jgi:hypothetical protein
MTSSSSDVVARDLDYPIGGFLGHTALYDGNGSVIQALYADGNAIRITTINDFKTTTRNFWGTAPPNIPSGRTSKGYYRSYCYSSNDFEQFEMRVAVVRAAYATSQIGADYTITAQWTPAYWGNQTSMPRRGIFRCDTFVLSIN